MTSNTRKLVIVSSLMALAFVATPALAICKYGSPHCVNPHPGPKAPTVNTTRLPDAPPGNDDCQYYGNCDDGSPEGTGPDGNPNGGLGNGGSPAVIIGQLGHFHPSVGSVAPLKCFQVLSRSMAKAPGPHFRNYAPSSALVAG